MSEQRPRVGSFGQTLREERKGKYFIEYNSLWKFLQMLTNEIFCLFISSQLTAILNNFIFLLYKLIGDLDKV